MADIIDAFVVTLGLDPRNYQREIKSYRDDRKRLSEEDTKYNRQSEDAQKRMVGGMRALRNETAGFLVMLAGANSIKDFAGNILTADATTGRLAKNLGLATEQVSAWEGAIKRVGGSAGDIQNALRSMSSAFQSLQLTGTTGNDADFQGLGVTAKDLQNPEEALLKISEASGRMGRPEFNARLSRLGFDQNTINLLARGRGEVTRMLEEQRKLGVATDESAEAAQRLQEKVAILQSALADKLRPIIEDVVTQLADWLEEGDNLNTVISIAGGLLVAMGIAAAAAFWPFTLLAGAIAVVAANLQKLKAAWDSLGDWWQNLGEKTDPFLDPIRSVFGMKSGRELREENASGAAAAPSAAGGGAKGALATGRGARNADYVERWFKARGYTSSQARGITAGVVAEGGLNARTGGGYKGRALGIGQLLGSRRAEFLRRYGPNFTLEDELEFMHWELQGGDPGGKSVLAAKNDRAVLEAMTRNFFRPAQGRETAGDLARGNRWLDTRPGASARMAGASQSTSNSQTTSIGQIVVYSAATDAEGIARDMRGALSRRGIVTQANTGLQP